MLKNRSTLSEGDGIEKERIFNRRIFFVVICQIFASFLAIVKLVRMQIFKQRSYEILSEKNQYKPSFIIPKRGNILSADNKFLAYNKDCFSAILDPDTFAHATKILQDFADLLDMPNKDRFVKMMERGIKQDPRQELILIENLSREQMLIIEYYLFRLDGVCLLYTSDAADDM
jgi:cell division protein FtsI/penicillin-binding protein 2